MYALSVLQGTLDKSRQQTAYITVAREKWVSARLLPAVAGSSRSPRLLGKAPPKAFFSFTHGSHNNTSWIHHRENQLQPRPGLALITAGFLLVGMSTKAKNYDSYSKKAASSQAHIAVGFSQHLQILQMGAILLVSSSSSNTSVYLDSCTHSNFSRRRL